MYTKVGEFEFYVSDPYPAWVELKHEYSGKKN